MMILDVQNKLLDIIKAGLFQRDDKLKDLAERLTPFIQDAQAKPHFLSSMLNEIHPGGERIVNEMVRYYEEKYGQ